MSQHPPQTQSSLEYQRILENALEAYKRKTGEDFRSNPGLSALESSSSPASTLALLRDQIPGFDRSGRNSNRPANRLNSTVNVLYQFSSIIGVTVNLAYPAGGVLFMGIASLLSAVQGVSASQGPLFELFDGIEKMFKRFEDYIKLPQTVGMTEVIVTIMVEVLLIISLATKEIRQGKMTRFLKKEVGRSEIDHALRRLEKLTKEELWTATTQGLRVMHGVDDKLDVVIGDTGEIRGGLQQVAMDVRNQKRNQLRQDLTRWLSPSDPFINYNTTSGARHKNTAVWFIESDVFKSWKESTSLLWIHGKPGAGKSVLASAIIKDINDICNTRLAHIGFFYFDFNDIGKQDARALLSSLIVQLSNQSNSFYDILLRFYSIHNYGTQQPSLDGLTQCLEDMLRASEKIPIYLIIDGVDECPNMTGMPSAREWVLNLVEKLVKLNLPSLHLCATSRLEFDIRASFEPLTSTPNCISLHDESGQRQDIVDFVRAVVYSDKNMRWWQKEDKELVIETLSKRADGMFRYVFCQLEALRQCIPLSLRCVLAELPESLDGTYERILQNIPKQNRAYAHKLLRCLVVAVRPLRVEELAEVVPVDFSSTGGTPTVDEKLRWEDQEQVVMSACSSLITTVDDCGSRLVQFSHFTVKEFLTSDRLAESTVDGLRYHYIRLEPAHKIMAQACLNALLRLDNDVDSGAIEWYHPLVRYASKHLHEHAKFQDVLSDITDGVDDLLDPDQSYLNTWLWLQIGDWDPCKWHNAYLAPNVRVFDSRPSSRLSLRGSPKYPPRVTPLYYVAALGHLCLAQRLMETRPQDLYVRDSKGCTPFHIAVLAGKAEVSRLLINDTVDLDIQDNEDHNLLHMAAMKGHVEVIRVLLEYDKGTKTSINERNKNGQTPLHLASHHNRPSIMKVLLEFGADVDAQDNDELTPLFFASQSARNGAAVDLLLSHRAKVNARNKNSQTPLHVASQHVNLNNMVLLIRSKAILDAQDNHGMTPLHLASQSARNVAAAHLLLDHGASVNVENEHGQTPLHLASGCGLSDVVASMLEKGAFVDAQDNYEMTPLLYASGPFRRSAVVQLLLERGASVDLRNTNGQTPLHVASENRFSDVVALLLNSGADVNARDDDHMTPLHFALSESSLSPTSPTSPSSWSSWSLSSFGDLKKVIELLLKHGADVHLKDVRGRTPFQMVLEADIEQLFLQYSKPDRRDRLFPNTASLALSP